jgi:hypothetical protein
VTGPMPATAMDSVIVDAATVRMGTIIKTKMTTDPGHATGHHRAADMSTSTEHSQRSAGNDANARAAVEVAQMSATANAAEASPTKATVTATIRASAATLANVEASTAVARIVITYFTGTLPSF